MSEPSEGVDERGFIRTGADIANIRPPFARPVADAVAWCRDRCAGGFGLYVYGSVATGRAVAGVSDLDLLLVADRSRDLTDAGHLAAELTARYARLLREVSLGTTTTDEVRAETPDGHASRCFLRHYCVCVAGRDLRPSLEPCRPTRALALAFAADTEPALGRIRGELARGGPRTPAQLARSAARKLLLTCAAITSVDTGEWTTDRRKAAADLASRYPARAAELDRALAWADPRREATTSPDEIRVFVDGFGGWVLSRLEDLRRP